MIRKLKTPCPLFCTGVVHSYSQVFFSNNRIFGIILLIVSFFDINAGIAGLLAVLATNLTAYLMGFNTQSVASGFYGFNSLLVGLGIGVFYQPGIEFYVLLFFISLLTLFITVALEGVIGKYGLPYLSIPFLLSIWVVTLAARQFTSLALSEKGIFIMNELFMMGNLSAVQTYTWLHDLNLPWPIRLYFRSMGAIFFQYHLVAGILIAIGLLIYSRIAFTLSVVGFFSAYLFYLFIGSDVQELSTAYIGFNFILTSIAIGGFFLIPSRYSYLWIILLTPITAILITSTMALFSLFQLSIFSLPFNIVVLLFLYILKFRQRFYLKPESVAFQQFSPEKNLYAHQNFLERFDVAGRLSFELPFFGTWKVTQGHNGEHTHQSDWRHAWDFEILNEEGKTYSGDGIRAEDYFCYNKPVLSPANGVVEAVVDRINDNPIGEVNLRENWGNTVVIHHSDHLYSQLSHLKKGSVTVKPGDYVRVGQVIAHCGNSGRSPYPHLHFQIQATPSVGSKTLDYPIGQYILHHSQDEKIVPPALKVFSKPALHQLVSNIAREETLAKAVDLVPGQTLTFGVLYDNGAEEELTWDVQTDPLNYTFLYCRKSRSKAYFRHEGNIHYFTHFEGNRKSLLFFYFLGGWRIVTGFYRGLQITDSYPLSLLSDPWLIFLQDFTAPFYRFLRSTYTLEYVHFDDDFTDASAGLTASAKVCVGHTIRREIRFTIKTNQRGIQSFIVEEGPKSITLILKQPL